jgi:hypothetical protein
MCGWKPRKRADPMMRKTFPLYLKIITMRKNMLLMMVSVVMIATTITSCDKDDDKMTTYYQTMDQMARPAINTVFVSAAEKDVFNTTTPSAQGGLFAGKFKNRLLALNASYTTNLLGLNADQFTGVLATDVLNVSTTAPTTFYDGTNVLTGRALSDDVIDVELILIFGGPNAMANPGLTSDHVDMNDKPFLSTFPYLAAPF